MKKIFTIITLLFLISGFVKAQSVYQPYTYQFYQKLNVDVYSTKTRVHSSLKPFFVDDSLLKHKYDSLMNVGVDTTGRHSWVHRKLFNEHLIDVKAKDYTFFADFLSDLTIGNDMSNKKR